MPKLSNRHPGPLKNFAEEALPLRKLSLTVLWLGSWVQWGGTSILGWGVYIYMTTWLLNTNLLLMCVWDWRCRGLHFFRNKCFIYLFKSKLMIMDVPFQITAFITAPKVIARLASRNIYPKKQERLMTWPSCAITKSLTTLEIPLGGLPFGVVLRWGGRSPRKIGLSWRKRIKCHVERSGPENPLERLLWDCLIMSDCRIIWNGLN